MGNHLFKRTLFNSRREDSLAFHVPGKEIEREREWNVWDSSIEVSYAEGSSTGRVNYKNQRLSEPLAVAREARFGVLTRRVISLRLALMATYGVAVSRIR